MGLCFCCCMFCILCIWFIVDKSVRFALGAGTMSPLSARQSLFECGFAFEWSFVCWGG